MRLSAHNLDQTLLARTVALAETTGGVGARPRRAALAAPPRFGAGRGEDTLHWLGHARRKAVGRVAPDRGLATARLLEEAGRRLVGHRRRPAALDLAWGEPGAPAAALRLVLEAGDRWQRGLEPPHSLGAPASPLQEGRDTLVQIVEQDTEPAPEASPGGRRLQQPGSPARRSSIEDKERRHGRTSSATRFNGFQEHWGLARDSTVPRAVVVRPANEPE